MRPGVLSIEFSGGRKAVAPKALMSAVRASMSKCAIPNAGAFLYGRSARGADPATLRCEFASSARYPANDDGRVVNSASNVSREWAQLFSHDLVLLAREVGFDDVMVTFPDIRSACE